MTRLFSHGAANRNTGRMAAGFVLFAMTIVVNTLAAMIVTRSRSGAQTEI